jgi:hypothetical protein
MSGAVAAARTMRGIASVAPAAAAIINNPRRLGCWIFIGFIPSRY